MTADAAGGATGDGPATIIRAASDADGDALSVVGSATFLDSFAGVLDGAAIVAHCRRAHAAEAYRTLLASGSEAWLCETRSGGAPVGYALAGPPDLACARPDGTDLELKRIYLLSRFRGGGRGAALLAAAEQAARDRGATRLLLGVYRGNAPALRFYRRHGFAAVDTRRFTVGTATYDDLVLAKPLP